MHEWLTGAADRLAAASGEEPAALALGPAEIEALLDVARVAAHQSGDRTNAPLASYLVGLLHGRHPERSLAELAAAVSESPEP